MNADKVKYLTAGRVHLMADNINSIGPHVKASRLRGLAVTSAKRVPAFSDLPTVAEAGVPSSKGAPVSLKSLSVKSSSAQPDATRTLFIPLSAS